MSAEHSEAEKAWEAHIQDTWNGGIFDEGMEYWDWSKDRFRQLESTLARERESRTKLEEALHKVEDLAMAERGSRKQAEAELVKCRKTLDATHRFALGVLQDSK